VKASTRKRNGPEGRSRKEMPTQVWGAGAGDTGSSTSLPPLPLKISKREWTWDDEAEGVTLDDIFSVIPIFSTAKKTKRGLHA